MDNNYNSQENTIQKQKSGNKVLIIVLFILIICLFGYIVYDKVLESKVSVNDIKEKAGLPNTDNETESLSDEQELEEVESEDKEEENYINETESAIEEQEPEEPKTIEEKEALKIATTLFKKMIALKKAIPVADVQECEEFRIGKIIPMCLYKGPNNSNNLLKDFKAIYSSEIPLDDVFNKIDDKTKIKDEEGELLNKYNYGALLYTIKNNKYYVMGECNKTGGSIKESSKLKIVKIEENKIKLKYNTVYVGELSESNLILVKENNEWKIGKGTDIPDGCVY